MTELWPGFTPTDYPVAVFDGECTRLYRHPNPPEEFRRDPSQDGVLVFPGRHPAVVASTTTELAGVLTATVLQAERPVLQAQIAHETFHVFCRLRHPTWTAHEMAAFAAPVEDADVFALRRMEAEALRRAVVEESAGWAAAAVRLRRDRFEQLPATLVRYERDLERLEGLAYYVESKAAGTIQCVETLATPSRPDDVRRFAYQTGEALAVLLDRHAPGWVAVLEADDSFDLDDLLRAAMGDQVPNEFSDVERTAVRQQAEEAVEALLAERLSLREEFLAQPGRVVLTASGRPFDLAGFDPMNAHHLGGGEVLHTRFLKLRGEGVELEMYDSGALTEGAGAHPFRDGIQRVTFAWRA
jgi:hypothetical protein